MLKNIQGSCDFMVRCCIDWASYAHNPLETYQSYALVLNVTSFGTDDKCVLKHGFEGC